MRLFIAVILNDKVKAELQKLQEELRSQAYKGSFTRPENFHLTLAFLGETPGHKLSLLFSVIQEIKTPAFKITFDHTGCFTHSRKELWWIGANPNEAGLTLLKEIHKELITSLEKVGFNVDKRQFNAHITLGREIKHLKPIVLNNPKINVTVSRISLVKSERIKGVLTYTELCSINSEGEPDVR